MMIAQTVCLVDNKHYYLSVEKQPMIIDGEGRLECIYTLMCKSTRATKFQGKKLLKRKLMAALRKGIANERSRDNKDS